MNQKTKIIILIVFILSITVCVEVYFFSQKKQIPSQPIQEVTKKTDQPETAESPKMTLEGMVISLNDKLIAISNNTPNPAVFSIDATTPVIKLDKEGKETPAEIADVVPGKTAKVLFDEKEEAQNKTARKIYLLEK